MYLEKLEAQGFKSFANKNALVFPGMLDKERRGITCVVGPNGSGKSNVADAIRWVLGEQSMKTLRGKKSEDVIFSGSDKKSKLGMAEVSLFLNNEDRRAPIDYSQIVLTRRLFRDGNSEYLINNSRVRLSDVQIMLAKAKFGQKTYSVIGQGMVEGFLNTSLAERKEFFDEATGVKQFQIKRDESLNKLRHSYENLSQVQMLLIEIEPRLKSLTRQVNKLQKREELEGELKELQLTYYSKNWHEINDKFSKFNNEYLELEKIKIENEKKLDLLNGKLAQMERENGINEDFNNWQRELNNLQIQKDSITKQLVKIDAQMEIKLEAAGKFDLSWLSSKKSEIKKDIEKIENELSSEQNTLSTLENEINILQSKKNEISTKINTILTKPNKKEGDKNIEEVNSRVKKLLEKIELAGTGEDINTIKTTISEIRVELKKILELSGSEDVEEDKIEMQSELMGLTRTQEEIISKINEKNIIFSSKLERKKLLEEKKRSLNSDFEDITNKLRQSQGQTDVSADQSKLKKELIEVEEKINDVRAKINKFSKAEEEKRSTLFELQKNIQNLQNEINNLNRQLNDLKISSTRYETKLEDLEFEIRESFKDLRKVKETRVGDTVDMDLTREKIHSIKRQLDMIGGIDPEIEKEYIETKERYDFLSGQTNDLSGAIKSLEKIIKELDIVIKERFDKEFKMIAQKFEEYFKILFNGGNAKISKVLASDKDKEDAKPSSAEASEGEKEKSDELINVGEIDLKRIKFLQKHNATGLAGVEIKATPPGKKITNVSMLSGGERALTAIALICAIISANPSPFVVLDEVDAALDEANSERLAKILDDLSHKTQFIIITHNRASMRRANILYGVTMGDDGISKLLSIKLDEAEKKVR